MTSSTQKYLLIGLVLLQHSLFKFAAWFTGVDSGIKVAWHFRELTPMKTKLQSFPSMAPQATKQANWVLIFSNFFTCRGCNSGQRFWMVQRYSFSLLLFSIFIILVPFEICLFERWQLPTVKNRRGVSTVA